MFRIRVTKTGKVIELDRQHMLTLVQTDAELGEVLMRAFILRRDCNTQRLTAKLVLLTKFS